MSLEIRVASRTDLSKKGLIDAIMQIFTDNDTNGENGPDYLSFEAAMHYGISSEKYYNQVRKAHSFRCGMDSTVFI